VPKYTICHLIVLEMFYKLKIPIASNKKIPS